MKKKKKSRKIKQWQKVFWNKKIEKTAKKPYIFDICKINIEN